MTFREYFLAEAFIGELASKYDHLDIPGIQSWSHRMYELCIDWAILQDRAMNDKAVNLLFAEVKKYRNFAIQALRDLHELEYKQSQLKRYYSNEEASRETELTLIRLSKWLKEYLCVILFSRACGDVTQYDSEDNAIKRSVTDTIKDLRNFEYPFDYDEGDYVSKVFIELYDAKTLPQLLIAISKAKNAQHDGGNIMTDWGTGLFRGNEKAFEEISNLNHRKMDRELQQELHP